MKNLIFVEPNGTFGVVGMNSANQDEKMYMCIVKLKDYERTGLNPDKIEALQYAHEDAIEEIKALRLENEKLIKIVEGVK